MIIKVGNEYINQRISVAIERKSKLFEAIGESQGDYSYSFTLEDTADTRKKLGITSINQANKQIYKRINASLLSDAGTEIYFGFIKIESIADGINCSFFSGNSNWMDELNVPLRDMDFSVFDKRKTLGRIENSWTLNSGIVFPLVDKGNLSTRGTNFLYTDDFHPFIFIKNIFEVIASSTGIKFSGGLFNEPRFDALITSNNGLSGVQKRIEQRTVYAGKTGTQTAATLSGDPDTSTSPASKVLFTNISTPYSNSDFNNWNVAQSHYVADQELTSLKVECNIIVNSAHHSVIKIVRNATQVKFFQIQKPSASQVTINVNIENISPGDTIEIQYEYLFTTRVIQPSSWVRITPQKFKTAFADAIVPNKTASEFISDVFRMFNVVAAYDPYSKTINCTLFRSVYNNTPIDLSPHITYFTEDYTELVSNYAMTNRLRYSQQSVDEIEQYNESNNIDYGDGVITIDNDHLESEGDIFELDFVAPYQKNIKAFSTSLPSLDFADTEDTEDTRTITSVSDNGGNAQFNWSSGGATNIIITDLVRVSDSSNDLYNGDFNVLSVTSSSVTLDVAFDSTATATATKIELSDNDNEDQVILLWQPEIALQQFSGINELHIGSTGITYNDIAFAFFFFPDIGVPFNYSSRKQALYFNKINDTSAIQRSIIEDEFVQIQRILNDPVKVTCEMYIPESVFNKLDLITPVRLRTRDFDGVFFVNLITAYEGSHLPCTVELIKLD